jgi:hypothetical protein
MDKQIDSGKARFKPPDVCLLCKKSFANADGFDGATVKKGGKVISGYGSRQHDGCTRYLDLKPGWYCYNCLDAATIRYF